MSILTMLWLFIPALATQVNAAEVQPKESSVMAATDTEKACPQPVLSRLKTHKVAVGETLETIAAKYNLTLATLTSLNPESKGKVMPIGKEVSIPPFNGIRVAVPANSRWQDVAANYGVRAEILYEVNGCQTQPQQVFVPGANWVAAGRGSQNNYLGFPGYPLPLQAKVSLSYGWFQYPKTGKATFHNGLDLAANPGTRVMSVDSGTVAFAGDRGSYGNLVVINHQGGRQTRYAHLQEVNVTTGQQVKQGDTLGKVGVTGNPDIDKPHLHFEVRYNSPQGWIAQDPEPNLKPRSTAQR
ncbi:MAG: M23 family metallopeptidase [Potamolinea sp.]